MQVEFGCIFTWIMASILLSCEQEHQFESVFDIDYMFVNVYLNWATVVCLEIKG